MSRRPAPISYAASLTVEQPAATTPTIAAPQTPGETAPQGGDAGRLRTRPTPASCICTRRGKSHFASTRAALSPLVFEGPQWQASSRQAARRSATPRTK